MASELSRKAISIFTLSLLTTLLRTMDMKALSAPDNSIWKLLVSTSAFSAFVVIESKCPLAVYVF